jgi:hypothetical protein
VVKEYTNYNGRLVLFWNLKLPLDGFDKLKLADEGARLFLQAITQIIPNSLGEVQCECYYKHKDNRVEFYFWNTARDKCMTVKFEYGVYEGYKNPNLQSLKNLLDSLSLN